MSEGRDEDEDEDEDEDDDEPLLLLMPAAMMAADEALMLVLDARPWRDVDVLVEAPGTASAPAVVKVVETEGAFLV